MPGRLGKLGGNLAREMKEDAVGNECNECLAKLASWLDHDMSFVIVDHTYSLKLAGLVDGRASRGARQWLQALGEDYRCCLSTSEPNRWRVPRGRIHTF